MPAGASRNALARPRTLARAIVAIGAIVALETLPAVGGDPLTVSEHAKAGQLVGRLSLPPHLSQSPLTTAPVFEIVAGNTAEAFSIDPASGELYVARTGVLNFESQHRHELTVRVRSASVGGDSAQRTFAADLLASSGDFDALAALFSDVVGIRAVIDVLDVDEPPVMESQAVTLVYEPGDRSGATATLQASDPESTAGLRYSILAGDPEGQLLLDETSGRVEISPNLPPLPGQRVVPLTVLVTDPAGNSDATTILVRVVGLVAPHIAASEPPAVSTEASDHVPATAPPANVVATAPQATDPQAAVELPTVAGVEEAPMSLPSPAPSHPRRTGIWYFVCGLLLGAGGAACIVGRLRREPALNRSAPPAAPARKPQFVSRPQPALFPPAPGPVSGMAAASAASEPAVLTASRNERGPVPEWPGPLEQREVRELRKVFASPHADQPPSMEYPLGDRWAVSVDPVAVAEHIALDPPVDSSWPETGVSIESPTPQDETSVAAPEAEAEGVPFPEPSVADIFFAPVGEGESERHEFETVPLPVGVPILGEIHGQNESATDAPAAALADAVTDPPELETVPLPVGMPILGQAHGQDESATDAPAAAFADAATDQPEFETVPLPFGAPILGQMHGQDESATDAPAAAFADAVTDPPEFETVPLPLATPILGQNYGQDVGVAGAPAAAFADAVTDPPEFETVPLPIGAPVLGNSQVHDVAEPETPGRDRVAAAGDSSDLPGEEPRVQELRRQLTELFGVPADYRPSPPPDEEEPVSESATAAVTPAESRVPEEVAPKGAVGADVVNLLDTLRARLNSELEREDESSSSADPDVTAEAFVLTPLTPETRLARSAAAELPSRVDKSAVRQEISSLRAVANIHARAIVARLSTEKRARHVWLISAICMVPLFSGGTYLLTSTSPAAMRWLGWLMLTGGAAAFSVCLNSFNRLSRLHEEDESADGGAGSTANSAHDTAEIAIPPELAAPAAELPVAEASAAEQCAEPQPEPDQLVTAP